MNFQQFLEKKKRNVEDVLGIKIKLLKFLSGTKKGTKIKINTIAYWKAVGIIHCYISGKSKRKTCTFYPNDFEFLEVVGGKK